MQRKHFNTSTQHHGPQKKGRSNLETLTQSRERQEHQHQGPRKDALVKIKAEQPPRRRRKKIPHKPPTIQPKKTPPSIPQQVGLKLALIVSLFASLSKPQRIALAFIILLGGAHAIETINNINMGTKHMGGKKPDTDTTKKTNNNSKQEIYKAVCTDKSIEADNKPNNITLGITKFKGKDQMMPEACVKDIKDGRPTPSDTCRNHTALYNAHTSNKSMINALRKVRDEKFNDWKNTILSQSKKIEAKQTAEQNEAYNEVMFTIGELKKSYILSSLARAAKTGNCGEHAAFQLTSLLQNKIKYGLEMKIQRVILNNTRKGDSHTYMLLDSDAEDITIIKNTAQVQQHFNRINKGKICDTWNNGYYADFSSDDSGLYKDNAYYDSAKIQTYSLNFANFKKLSPDAQRLVCTELAKMGLNVEPQSECRMYRKPVNQPQEDKETSQEQKNQKKVEL